MAPTCQPSLEGPRSGVETKAEGDQTVNSENLNGWRKLPLIAIAFGISLISSLAVAIAPASASSATILLSKASGPPSSTITVTGTGFAPSTGITVTFNGTPSATATTDISGAFTATVTVVKTTPPRTYPVVASDSFNTSSAPFIVRTNWTTFHFSDTGTGVNPYENILNAGNAHSLTAFGTGTLSSGSTSDVLVGSSAVIYNGTVFVKGYYGHMYAFKQACFATVKSCAPLWIAPAGGGQSEITVANGVVYVASASGSGFSAYSATGSSTYCSGTAPKICKPEWIGSTPFDGANEEEGLTVTGATVFFTGGGSHRYLYAFNTKPTAANCVTSVAGLQTCSPLWSGHVGYDIAQGVSVSGGLAYVSADHLYAFNVASSPSYCSTSAGATTCNPVWTGSTTAGGGEPVISGGKVYTTTNNGILTEFPVGGGGANCTGPASARVCSPLWSTPIATAYMTPAISNGMIYAAGYQSYLNVLNASTGALLWSSDQNAIGQWSTPTVANGVVYTSDFFGSLRAYSATKTASCTGTVPVCLPLWTSTQTHIAQSTPVVVDGTVYVTSGQMGNKVQAFHT